MHNSTPPSARRGDSTAIAVAGVDPNDDVIVVSNSGNDSSSDTSTVILARSRPPNTYTGIRLSRSIKTRINSAKVPCPSTNSCRERRRTRRGRTSHPCPEYQVPGSLKGLSPKGGPNGKEIVSRVTTGMFFEKMTAENKFDDRDPANNYRDSFLGLF